MAEQSLQNHTHRPTQASVAEEFGGLPDRAVREKLVPKDIKGAIKTWRPDLYRT